MAELVAISTALELRFPRRDLIGVDVELLRKLSQCSIALDGNRGQKFIFRLFRQVIRAARIRYDRQVVFGLPHHLRMRSSPKLHVLKPWLNRFIFRLRRTMFW